MFSVVNTIFRPKLAPAVLAAALTGAGVIAPAAAFAQDDVPSYAHQAPQASQDGGTIRGRIRSVDGAYHITVRDDRGFVDSVQLHQGTIINPTGLTLATGMSVTISGYNAGASFDANEIDTPYTYDGPAVDPGYYGPGWYYPGYGYPYGYGYGYGPDVRFGFGFGHGGYDHFHGGGFHGGAGFHGGGGAHVGGGGHH